MTRQAQDGPATRRERRAVARAERAAQRPATRRAARPAWWRSPMVLFTVGALAVGLVIVAYWILQRPGPAPTTDIQAPAVEVPAGLADGQALGSADAPVTIEIWSDFQCPACRTLAEEVEPLVVSRYVEPGIARLEYHDAAFQGARAGGTYDESVEPAAAARCAADQGRFWEMHNWLFANWDGENEGGFRAERLRAIASAAGLDMPRYDACMASGEKQAAVRNETSEALARGINSTPTLVINGRSVVGVPSYVQLAAMIEDAAAAAGQ